MNSRNRDRNPEFENHLLSIKTERQEMIHPNSPPTYNERHQKIIEMIDWTLENYRIRIKETHNEQVTINDIIKELDKKRDITINKKRQALLTDEVYMYRLEEITLDYVLFIIPELTGKLV